MCSGMWRALPNLLTLVRIALTPFILLELARGRYMIAGWTFGAAAWTDIFDGMLARRFGAQSKAGQYLDPIADKILLTSLYIGLALGGAVPVWIVVLILTRDVWILLLSGIALRFTQFRELQPSIWGKASTFVQIMAAVGTIGARAYESDWFLRIARVLLDGVVLLALISGGDYTIRGIRYFSRVRAGSVSTAEAARRP
jgi:cardiolipin synthase (CMP-forming)